MYRLVDIYLQEKLSVLSSEAKIAAVEIEKRLQLGSKLSEIVQSKEDVEALFNLYRNEGYILAERNGKFCVSIDFYFLVYLVQ